MANAPRKVRQWRRRKESKTWQIRGWNLVFWYVRLKDAREVAGAVVLHAYGERELTGCCPLRLELAPGFAPRLIA